MKSSILRPRTKSSFIRCSSSTPMRTRRLRMALPSNRRFGSFSSRVNNSRAALRILARVYFTRHTSLLLRRPYSPMSFNSWSRRAFSKGRRGVTNVLLQTFFILADGGKGETAIGHFNLYCAWRIVQNAFFRDFGGCSSGCNVVVSTAITIDRRSKMFVYHRDACVSADLDPSRFWIPYDVTHCLGMRSSLKCRKVTYKMCVAHPRKWIRFLLAGTVLADLIWMARNCDFASAV